MQNCDCLPVQVAGVALATAGFIIATRWFGVPYNIVMFSHGKMGVAILVLVYSQVCVCVCLGVCACMPQYMQQLASLCRHTAVSRPPSCLRLDHQQQSR